MQQLNSLNYFYQKKVDSTNNVLKNLLRESDLPEFFIVRTSFQTAGKGQSGNSWESPEGKNLLFSLLIRPESIKIDQQFIISEMISLAILDAVIRISRTNFNPQLLRIKWPNDIYYGDRKLGGILIENTLKGRKIVASVIGAGINVNQLVFTSDVPNPVSISNITHKPSRKLALLAYIITYFKHLYGNTTAEDIHQQYLSKLYRFGVWHQYRAENEVFTARIKDVKTDGALVMETKSGEIRQYYFKEIEFVINP